MSKHKIVIETIPNFLPEQSSFKLHNYVWTYKITITNNSEEVIQLLSRYWRIMDATGKITEVQGLGVVGLQPVIKPGTSFTYESFCQLETSEGSMEGYYEFQTLSEERFIVQIPKFILITPENDTGTSSKHLH